MRNSDTITNSPAAVVDSGVISLKEAMLAMQAIIPTHTRHVLWSFGGSAKDQQ
jgi:hypothetical protein